MEYIQSRDGIYDGQSTQVFRYHPQLAPKGQRFWSDDLPTGEGWVDTPAKFPGYRNPGDPVTSNSEPAARNAPTEHFRYHKVHGAKRFFSDAMPSQEDGWFDNPRDAGNWVEADLQVETEDAVAPDPSAYSAFDAFMEAWCGWAITDDLPPSRKAELKKEGIEAYARVRHNVDIDRRRKLEDLVAQVEALEG